ncbi:ATP-dependent DNA helicase PcrA [Treponema primitia ZAS-2]|uniref:DNA 3'-5' helicase n=1 Tax=Treponema primitia (strain ATCC BAA-887 / DSM 12427 / ZAS-2) TaxID=545694 RepID=F5YGT7_TREPZ|nr:UvrD-helicase domain-containing protein [Treponema primitia]AEF84185.1 ATP-dependent DNA helicase PcrA [Treponema primitia ZAS-2]
MTSPLPPYLETLNPEQRQAVLHTGKSLLILAGAGSGKTRVITTKIAWLIQEQGVDPRSILAVTFTNKAAREMAERARLIDERAAGAMLRTFHSFGAWFLRRNGTLGGLNSNFTIYDDDDVVSLLSTLLEDIPKPELRQIAHSISRAKDYFLSPEDPELDLINQDGKFRSIYGKYEERMAQIGNMDFGDLIKKPVEILRNNPAVAQRFRDRFRVILVDEYQDSNIAQAELLKELCSPSTYICVVGDDDQSIYRFRGAEVRNILEFPGHFEGTDIIRLERNYRSFSPILDLASSVVNKNEGRLGKTLFAERGSGKIPTLAFLPDQDAEASFCAELIQKSVNSDGKRRSLYADWAILYRTNAQSLGFETEFLRRRIPYRVVGSLKFYEREEIKDALALLSFLVNPRDEIGFRRVVNKPTRGAGPATVDRIVGEALMDGSGGDLAAAALRIMPELPPKARSGIRAFLTALKGGLSLLDTASPATNDAALPAAGPTGKPTLLFPGNQDADTTNNSISADTDSKGNSRKPDNILLFPDTSGSNGTRDEKDGGKRRARNKKQEGLRAGEGLSACVARLVEDSGIAEYHLTHDDVTSNQRIGNLQELINAASLYPATREGLLEFLEHIELDRSIEQEAGKEGEKDVVTLITLHNTKGLEFRRVIMTGVEQGVFPRDDKNGDDLEEERRLFYVGATRAMDELYLTSCAMRRMYGRTMPMEASLFLGEADKAVLRVIGNAPYGFAGSTSRAPSPRQQQNYDTPGPGKAKASSDGRWKLGDRVFQDDQGYGAVTEIRESEEGPVILVRFETGKENRFLSLHQSSRYTKIGDDV